MNKKTEELYEYIKTHFNLDGHEAVTVHNIVKFVLERDGWGVNFKLFALAEMLDGIGITEGEILPYIVDEIAE